MPGVPYWISEGATTLWERWQGQPTNLQGSANHIMYGGWGNWLYEGVAGLQRTPGSPGWTDLTFAPPVGFASPSTSNNVSLTRASASVDTAVGLVATSWDSAPLNTGTCAVVSEHMNATLTCDGGG
jgi:alpha-L-rhamnosidase